MAVFPKQLRTKCMLAKRVVTSLILAAVGLPAIVVGGIYYFLLIAFFIGLAAWEYVNLFRAVKMQPSMVMTIGGVLLVLVARAWFPTWAGGTLTILILIAMTYHLIAYERGRDQAALDLTTTLGGIVYLGWIGAYLIDLRNLPNGMTWLLIVLPAVWLADSGAYFVGKRWGRHWLSPRLSPKKTWEGYWAGVVTGTLGGVLMAWIWSYYGGANVSLLVGAALGLVLSLFTTLGDLGESLFKRLGGIKDSGNIFPGHGGAFDRIDSWLWAAVLGYYLISWFIL